MYLVRQISHRKYPRELRMEQNRDRQKQIWEGYIKKWFKLNDAASQRVVKDMMNGEMLL